MEKSIPWHIITKYLRKETSPEELAELNNWLEEDETNQNVLTEIQNVYEVTSSIPQALEPNKEIAWRKIEQRITSGTPVKKLFEKFKYVAAAVIILLVGLSVVWLFNAGNRTNLQQYTEIVTPMGQKSMVILPDSSCVWLNSGSSLKYKGDFNVKEREVILKGEAFFEVKEDSSKSFRVKTGILDVKVYGTSFNIKNYEDDRVEEITVMEGIVGVSDESKELRRLTRGEQASLNKETNRITYTENNPDLVSAWKNNELIFDNTPLEEVVKYLERWYGVDIALDSEMKGKHSYTFRVKTESFREMLEMLKVMTPIIYEIRGKDVKIKYSN
ncbi:FecR family protein [Mariniphaga sediminis]|uniref:FecR family protein n=1 Tax=Mariniphaga sediminis TaxID=1628158 RepID=UPI00356683AF